jgi:two-component system, NarL family, nitrate/nitrite response regulator NarL
MMKAAIYDDHPLFRDGLELLLGVRGIEVRVFDGAPEGLVRWAESNRTDVVLLDLDLGSAGTSLPLITPLRAVGATVVIVTGVDDPIRRAECIEAGAAGIISKQAPLDQLIDEVVQAASTGSSLTHDERNTALRLLREHRQRERARLGGLDALTPREAYVLGRLVEGYSVKAIAEDAVVSVTTVRSQVRAILGKLDVHSQLAAVGLARRAGWQPPLRSTR